MLEISGSSITVTLWWIKVTGGGTDADHGGGIEVRGSVILNPADAHIAQNDSDLGGGIYFAGTAGADEQSMIFDDGFELGSDSA